MAERFLIISQPGIPLNSALSYLLAWDEDEHSNTAKANINTRHDPL